MKFPHCLESKVKIFIALDLMHGTFPPGTLESLEVGNFSLSALES
jgi:hypothetical protein